MGQVNRKSSDFLLETHSIENILFSYVKRLQRKLAGNLKRIAYSPLQTRNIATREHLKKKIEVFSIFFRMVHRTWVFPNRTIKTFAYGNYSCDLCKDIRTQLCAHIQD